MNMAKHELHDRIPALRLRQPTISSGQAFSLHNFSYSRQRSIPLLSKQKRFENTWLWMKSQCDLSSDNKAKNSNEEEEYTALQPNFVPDLETADWGNIATLANGPAINSSQTESFNDFERRLREFAAIMAQSLPNLSAITDESAFVITDIPAGVVIGYDTKSLTVAENKAFLGLKEVPKGAHFLWAGSGDNSSRSGFWIITPYAGNLKDGHVVIKQWDIDLEVLISNPTTDESEHLAILINQQKDQLIPYNATSAGSSASDISTKYPTIWSDLTSCIKESTLSHITQVSIWNNWCVSTTDENIKDSGLSSAVQTLNQETLRFFFPGDERTFSRETVGRERTNQVMDSSSHVISVIQNECDGDADEIVGEIQFCYLMGMILGNISCLMHWQHVVKIIFKAPQLTLDNPTFFRKFIDTVRTQLTYDNVGIDGSIFDHDNELHRVLKPIIAKFKARFEEIYRSRDDLTEDQKEFQEAFNKFEEFMKTFEGGWDLSLDYLRVGRWQLEDGEYVEAELSEFQDEDERGEYAPAIVELDEDGRESGLIRF